MSRWEPDARGRLEQAALDLFSERGFDQTTAAQIAERAGLTERTFFRHYTDKREVLFGQAHGLSQAVIETFTAIPETVAPIDAVDSTLEAIADRFFDYERARRRYAVIMANTELRERELIKMACLSADLADALRRRGVAEPAASLAAEAGITVYKVGFQRWMAGTGDRTLAEFFREALDELKAVTAGG